MAQPIWNTPSESIGTFASGVPMSITVSASAVFPSTYLTYKLQSGSLPNGLSIDQFGTISGTPKNVINRETSSFTIRVTDEFTNLRDRTFSISITGSLAQQITTTPGEILVTYDSQYVNYSIQYTNPIASNTVTFTITSGLLPPGLSLSEQGTITGYPMPPILGDGSPTSLSYFFSIALSSSLGIVTAGFSILVINYNLEHGNKTRPPVILNSNPLNLPLSTSDPYYNYYLIGTNQIPLGNAGEFYSFKIIGYDFDLQDVFYQFEGLPPGLAGDNVTGWISGFPKSNSNSSINSYTIRVSISKANDTTIVSPTQIYSMTVANNIAQDVVWVTPSNLGTLFNGTISELFVEATSSQLLNYKIASGSLPPNLILLPSGEISGRVAFQPTTNILPQGVSTTFTFSIQAFNNDYALLHSTQEFTLTVEQYYPVPLENIYLKATPGTSGKQIINSLLTFVNNIPNAKFYRPNDEYFGVATNASFIHMYGMTASSLSQYLSSIQQNHFKKNVILGPLKTAIATDNLGNELYEVIYSTILDSSTNNGASTPDAITWTEPVSLNKGPWTINQGDILINNSTITDNLTPGSTTLVYPNSLQNMGDQVSSIIKQNTDSGLLPKWMITPQSDNNTIGFIRAWVICYTQPGYSLPIANYINQNWQYKLNQIEFDIDRYYIDKSATYNWNTYLSVPIWATLPSASPQPNPVDTNDLVVLFPNKYILPNRQY